MASACRCRIAIRNKSTSGRPRRSGQMAALLHGDTFFLDNFALRQFDDPLYGGTKVKADKVDFVRAVHDHFKQSGSTLTDGYAPFCKHIFVPNFVGAKLGALRITDANRHLLRSGYTRRRPEELPVLSRWFRAADVEVPEAKFLDIILYSREQLLKEYAAMPTAKGEAQELPDVPWGIISVKAQDEAHETPMQPITMMRNALGREEGGSGVALDKQAYNKAAAWWEDHATIVEGDTPNGE
ncbi:flagellar associated protein [Haematococcus lacustris]